MGTRAAVDVVPPKGRVSVEKAPGRMEETDVISSESLAEVVGRGAYKIK